MTCYATDGVYTTGVSGVIVPQVSDTTTGVWYHHWWAIPPLVCDTTTGVWYHHWRAIPPLVCDTTSGVWYHHSDWCDASADMWQKVCLFTCRFVLCECTGRVSRDRSRITCNGVVLWHQYKVSLYPTVVYVCVFASSWQSLMFFAVFLFFNHAQKSEHF